MTGFEEDAVNIQEQKLDMFLTEVKLPLYSFSTDQSNKVGMATIKLAAIPNNAIAFLSDEAIQPLFKQGSIFIVDTQLKPKNDSLVAIKVKNYSKILIKKFTLNAIKSGLNLSMIVLTLLY